MSNATQAVESGAATGRIARRFAELAKRGELGIVAYLTAGDPTLEATEKIVLAAAEAGADHAIWVAARRRLNVIREVISALTTPQFGRRSAQPKSLTPEERSRRLLGLPLDRRLSESEIHRAYKLLAKRTHPDAGGSEEAFLRISAAQETLIRERRMPPRH